MMFVSGLLARGLAFFKRRPYVISLVFVFIFFLAMWVGGRERPFELENVSRNVVDALAADPVLPEPRFQRLKTTIKREIRIDGLPAEVIVERTESRLQYGIALRREQWYHNNLFVPVRESRSFGVGGLMTLDYDERSPLPVFGALLKEDGWAREKVTELKINEKHGFPSTLGGVLDFTKLTSTDLNPYTGLRETLTQKTRCTVESKTVASRIHSRLNGDAYQVNCRSEKEVRTQGGIPPKERVESSSRVTAYYFIEQWSWFFQWIYSEGDYRQMSELVSFELN
jgi:hypothetical protein